MTSCTRQPEPGAAECRNYLCLQTLAMEWESAATTVPSDLSKCHDRMALPISARWQDSAASELTCLCQQAMWRECNNGVLQHLHLQRPSQLTLPLPLQAMSPDQQIHFPHVRYGCFSNCCFLLGLGVRETSKRGILSFLKYLGTSGCQPHGFSQSDILGLAFLVQI